MTELREHPAARTCACGERSRVVATGETRENKTWRRRACVSCYRRWTTVEVRVNDSEVKR